MGLLLSLETPNNTVIIEKIAARFKFGISFTIHDVKW